MMKEDGRWSWLKRKNLIKIEIKIGGSAGLFCLAAGERLFSLEDVPLLRANHPPETGPHG
ncbi:hypothetical protein GsuE55_10700 [Geobacillus subterraneus]|uniref:Uncharacterized protein n=1 Tax=Geobacillus subterraneus TaxID=129338 RepID=A0A679FPT1_9BACL|nr:hypothetical protein GsuE55_10700 [Geobacillus subterraneus]